MLFAPEVALWRAFTQFEVARELCKTRNRGRFDQETKTFTPPHPEQLWGLEHGYFALMGGFVVTPMPTVDIDITSLNALPNTTLTPLGIAFLAQMEMIPKIDSEDIKGRSKADEIAKTLVCLQAGWMVVQTIVRAASQLPVTLLELNTLAHVACAFAMYALWWKKPQNVSSGYKLHVTPAELVLLARFGLFQDFIPLREWPHEAKVSKLERGNKT